MQNLVATPIVVTGISRSRHLGAVALDTTTQHLYLTDPLTLRNVHRVPVSGGGARPVGTAGMHGVMATEHDGSLLMPTFESPPRIQRMDPRTGTVHSVGTTGGNANGIQIEAATGRIAFVTNGYNGPPRRLRLMDPTTGGYAELGTVPTGFVSGIDIAPDPAVYGGGTVGAASYGWCVGPGAGGLPRIGNAGFAVRVTSTSATVAGVLFGSLGSDHIELFGVRVLLDPGGPVRGRWGPEDRQRGAADPERSRAGRPPPVPAERAREPGRAAGCRHVAGPADPRAAVTGLETPAALRCPARRGAPGHGIRHEPRRRRALRTRGQRFSSRASPVIGTKRTGSTLRRLVPSGVFSSTTSSCRKSPTGMTIRPPTASCSTSGSGR